MEKLNLSKFQDSKLENLRKVLGGVEDFCFTTLDGVEQGDIAHPSGAFFTDYDGDGYYEGGNAYTTEGAC